MTNPEYITDEAVKAIETNYTYHPPKDDQLPRYQLIRDKGKALALLIADVCPAGREKSLALMQVEQAVMWANAAIARNEI